MEPIVRSEGLNRSEEILARLCDHAFLPLWCYPNLFRAKNRELADVLVVFGDDVIIFSDKSCAFPNSGDLEQDWSRWLSRSVDDSIRQIRRAERWLIQRPAEVYLDVKCSKPFPFTINPKGRFHRIVVARNARARCAEAKQTAGSLIVHGNTVEAPVHPVPFELFMSQYADFIHVFDEVTLPTVLEELDTAADFLDYLTKKEAVFRSGQLMTSVGEEETLSAYVASTLFWNKETGHHDFPVMSPPQPMILGAGLWKEHRSRPEYPLKKRADRGSYLWDRILKDFGDGVHLGDAPNPLNAPITTLEMIGRRIAVERRFRRRALSSALAHAQVGLKGPEIRNRTVLSASGLDKAYVFSLYPPALSGEDYEQYRTNRRNYGLLYGHHVMQRTPSLDSVIVISTDLGRTNTPTFDFTYVHRDGLDDELKDIVREAAEEYGWSLTLTDLALSGMSPREYPRDPRISAQTKSAAATRKKRKKSERLARKAGRSRK